MSMSVSTCLWFAGNAEEAVKFYTSLFPNSRMGDITYYNKGMPMPEGTVLTISFQLAGRDFMALNAGPHDNFNDAHSMVASCETQEEVDRLWTALTKDGGREVQCGWLKDKYGLSWQIVPVQVLKMLTSGDIKGTERMMHALMDMRKLDIAALEAAYGRK
jgi:two-component system sensor histidine kinase QseC